MSPFLRLAPQESNLDREVQSLVCCRYTRGHPVGIAYTDTSMPASR